MWRSRANGSLWRNQFVWICNIYDLKKLDLRVWYNSNYISKIQNSECSCWFDNNYLSWRKYDGDAPIADFDAINSREFAIFLAWKTSAIRVWHPGNLITQIQSIASHIWFNNYYQSWRLYGRNRAADSDPIGRNDPFENNWSRQQWNQRTTHNCTRQTITTIAMLIMATSWTIHGVTFRPGSDEVFITRFITHQRNQLRAIRKLQADETQRWVDDWWHYRAMGWLFAMAI